MAVIALPTTTAPGQHPQESGGRLINAYAESLADTAGSKLVLRRVPGLVSFGTTTKTGYRGSIAVGGTLYSAFSGSAVRHSSGGGAATALAGSLPGTAPVIFSRNNASMPDVVAVAPGDGAYILTGSSVSAYPDIDIGQPNSVTSLKGFFIFGYGNGLMLASNLNSTAIVTTNYASAESKPDTLYRVVATPAGQLLAAGSETLEFWGGINDTGFPFSYSTTVMLGIAGPYCITGDQDGWGQGLFLIGSDYVVYRLQGYTPQRISSPDLDRLIAAVVDKTTIQMSVFVSGGHSFVVVRSPAWCWVYDVNTGAWHERASHLEVTWRALGGTKIGNAWVMGDADSGNLLAVEDTAQSEAGKPLVAKVETGPVGSFPRGARVNRLDLMISVGVGEAPGLDPIETDPAIEISISRDNGLSWSAPWVRRLGQQATFRKVTVNNMGHVQPHGVKLRFAISDPVHVGIMGGDLDAQVIGK
jgi:hypothetical protein